MTLRNALIAEGLAVQSIGKAGRPGGLNVRFIAPHWTATRSSSARRHPTLPIVRDGYAGLAGPLYQILVPWQNNPNNLQAILVSTGRANHYGMANIPLLSRVANGELIPRRTPSVGDTGGANGIGLGISADYHPAQGAPHAAWVEAFGRCCAAAVKFYGLSWQNIADHAMGTRRKVDNLQHWPDFRYWVRDYLNTRPEPEPEDDDMKLKHGDQGPNVQRAQQEINTWRKRQGLPLLSENGTFGTTMVDTVKEFQRHVGFDQTGEIDYWTHQRLQQLNLFARLNVLEGA